MSNRAAAYLGLVGGVCFAAVGVQQLLDGHGGAAFWLFVLAVVTLGAALALGSNGSGS